MLRDHRATAPGRLSTKQFFVEPHVRAREPGIFVPKLLPQPLGDQVRDPVQLSAAIELPFVTETTVTPMETNASRRIESFRHALASA